MSFLIQQFNCQPQFQYGNPLDSIPLWVAAREDNTLSSRLTRPSQFPSVSFYYFTYIGIWPGSYQDCQIKKDTVSGVSFYLAASYPPRPDHRPGCLFYENPEDFFPLWTYSPAQQDFVVPPSISAFVSLTSVLAWEQRQRLVVAGYHSTESKSEWISYKW